MKLKRFTALLMALVMVLTLAVPAFATGEEGADPGATSGQTQEENNTSDPTGAPDPDPTPGDPDPDPVPGDPDPDQGGDPAPTTYALTVDEKMENGAVEIWVNEVKLDKAVGEKTGWLGFNIASDSEINTRYYTVAGYRDNKLKYGFGWAAAYDDNLMLFNADEVAGNSGGPVYLNYQDRADAIIVAEAPEANVNIGRRITRYIWDCMQKDGYQ